MTGSTCLGYQLVVTHCHKNHHFSTEESSFFLIEESSFFLIEESPFVYKTDRTKFLNLGDVCNNANSNMFSNDGFLLKNDDFIIKMQDAWRAAHPAGPHASSGITVGSRPNSRPGSGGPRQMQSRRACRNFRGGRFCIKMSDSVLKMSDFALK